MKRPDGLIICDYHKRGGTPVWHGEVLDDGVTFIDGYIHANKDSIIQFISEDPQNSIKQVGVLQSRHTDQSGNSLVKRVLVNGGSAYHITEGEYDFCNFTCLEEWSKDGNH